MNRCVNCRININRSRQSSSVVFEEDARTVSIISEWISPVIITENDNICRACRDLARNPRANQRILGHVSVCCLCGRSLLALRFNLVSQQRDPEIQYIRNEIAPYEIRADDKLCRACSQMLARRTTAETSRLEEINEYLRHPDIQIDNVGEYTDNDDSDTDVDHSIREAFDDVAMLENTHRSSDWVPNSSFEDSTTSFRANSSEILLPGYKRSGNSSFQCIFSGCNNGSLQRVSDELRTILVIDHHFYIPTSGRICQEHLNCNSWASLQQNAGSLPFTAVYIEHIFILLASNRINQINFNNVLSLDDHLFKYWFGLSKESYSVILAEVPRIRETKKGELGLVALLLKLRNGDSDDRIASLLNTPRRSVEYLMAKVRDILIQDFVPKNLGLSHLRREDTLQHNLLVPNSVFNNTENALVVCDGTYIYIDKSSNYKFQKESYSLHKYKNLLKCFMIVLADGYILDCSGPHKATSTDAQIMSSLFMEGSEHRNYFQEGDIFLMDRGFRDCVGMLDTECGYKAYIPASLERGQHQLSSQLANANRCLTMCRWVVEAVNGQLKRDFKLFRQHFNHRSMLHMMDDFRIGASLINRFGKRFQNPPLVRQYVELVNERRNLNNNLADMVEIHNLNRRSASFTEIVVLNTDNNIDHFPVMQKEDLVLFAMGTYQVRQALSYYGEHVRSQEGFKIEISQIPNTFCVPNIERSEGTLLRAKIKSRHVSAKIYFVYIITKNNINGRAGILEYCCSCIIGRRTLGCCAHVMTVVWFLGLGRYQDNTLGPAAFLDRVFLTL